MLLARRVWRSGGDGTFDANVDLGGTAGTYAASCELLESDSFHRGFSSDGDASFEIVWRKATVVTAGTYEATGIVTADVVVYVAYPGLPQITSVAGSITFTTLDPPRLAEGAFDLARSDVAFTATGMFSCR